MPRPRVAILMLRETAYTRQVAEGVTLHGRERGWQIGLVAEQPVGLAEHLLQWGAAGVVTCAYPPRQVRAMEATGLPVVATNTAGPGDPAVRVIPDAEAVGGMAAGYLLGLGFDRLAVVAQPAAPIAVERNAAFIDAVRAARRDEPAVYRGPVHHGQVAEVATDSRALGAWLADLAERGGGGSGGGPLGVFAYWDAVARQVLSACDVAGLVVPRQVAVLGVDNDPLLCELADPPLSSIDLGPRRIGTRAAEVLGAIMDGQPPPADHVRVPPLRVVERLSTDLVAVDDPDVAAAVEFIRGHAHKPIGVADIEGYVGVADRKLERAFRKRLGLTMHAELTRQRMQIAKDLLLRTDLTIEQIASRCGYANGPHLSKTFRKHAGVTPGRFRSG